MKCYIRNLLIFNPNQKSFDDKKYSIEAIVNNYPKHERAKVRVKREEKGRECTIGEVLRIYITDCCIYGDIEFNEDWKDIVCYLHKKTYTEVELRSIGDNPDFSCLDKVIFVDNKNYTKPVDLGSIISEQEYAYWMFNRPRYDSAQEATQPETDTLFKKKYDNEKSGFIDHVISNDSETSTMQEAPFIHAPGLSRDELTDWLGSVMSALYTEKSYYASQMADIEKKKEDLNKDFNERIETLKKAFPQLDPESILSQGKKGVSI